MIRLRSVPKLGHGHGQWPYIGENAFGAKRQISRMEQHELVVTAPASAGSVWWPNGFKGYSFNVPLPEAKRTKENLTVLLAARLTDPYLESEHAHVQATIDAPYDVYRRKEIIHTWVDCAAIYDRLTGRVIPELKI